MDGRASVAGRIDGWARLTSSVLVRGVVYGAPAGGIREADRAAVQTWDRRAGGEGCHMQVGLHISHDMNQCMTRTQFCCTLTLLRRNAILYACYRPVLGNSYSGEMVG